MPGETSAETMRPDDLDSVSLHENVARHYLISRRVTNTRHSDYILSIEELDSTDLKSNGNVISAARITHVSKCPTGYKDFEIGGVALPGTLRKSNEVGQCSRLSIALLQGLS